MIAHSARGCYKGKLAAKLAPRVRAARRAGLTLLSISPRSTLCSHLTFCRGRLQECIAASCHWSAFQFQPRDVDTSGLRGLPWSAQKP
eukprot:128977-Pyramimonas_sp.AAC.1